MFSLVEQESLRQLDLIIVCPFRNNRKNIFDVNFRQKKKKKKK